MAISFSCYDRSCEVLCFEKHLIPKEWIKFPISFDLLQIFYSFVKRRKLRLKFKFCKFAKKKQKVFLQNGIHHYVCRWKTQISSIYTKTISSIISEIFNKICFTPPTLRVVFTPLTSTMADKKKYGSNIFSKTTFMPNFIKIVSAKNMCPPQVIPILAREGTSMRNYFLNH